MTISITWPLNIGQVQCPSVIFAKESTQYTLNGERESGVTLEQRCLLVSGHAGRHGRDIGNGIITWPNT